MNLTYFAEKIMNNINNSSYLFFWQINEDNKAKILSNDVRVAEWTLQLLLIDLIGKDNSPKCIARQR